MGEQRAERVSCGVGKGFCEGGLSVFVHVPHSVLQHGGVLMHKKVPSHNSRK
jgi:hypothetical protein